MAKIGLTLNDYWMIIRKRKWIAIFSFLSIFLSVVINTKMQTSIYKATCSIRVIERRSVSDMITQLVSYTSFDLMGSLSKVLSGRLVIEEVVYELGLADKNTPPDVLNTFVAKIQNSVKTEKELNTNIINITVESDNPDMAAKIANTIAKVYTKMDMEEKTERARNLRVFLEEQASKIKQRLTVSEDRLKAFREKGEVTGIAVRLEDEVANLEKQKMELGKIYTEKYPDVIRIKEHIVSLKKELKDLPQSELEFARLLREKEVDEKSYLLLQEKLDEARIAEAESSEDIKIVNPAIVPSEPIRPNKQLNMILGLLAGLAIGLLIAFVVETLDTSIGTIDDLEAILKLPVLAVIPYMKPEVRGRENWLGRMINKSKVDNKDNIERLRQQILIKYSQKSSATEAYRILRTNIKVEELLKNDERILLITSTIPREGKSITALNLSLALAQDGHKTLLIDCDLRKAILHKILKLDREPGFTDILLGIVKPEAAIRDFVDLMISDKMGIKDILTSSGLDNFNLITCGKIVSNPAELLDSKGTNELFAYLKTQYNFIVVDSPPVLPVPDAVILAKKIIDKLYFVYRGGYTSKLAILRAKEQLEMVKILPTGIILNSTTPESQIVSNYYHHYYHYKYYAEKEGEKKLK